MKPGAMSCATDLGKKQRIHPATTEKILLEGHVSCEPTQARATNGANKSLMSGANTAQADTARASRVTIVHISFLELLDGVVVFSSSTTTVTLVGGPLPLDCRLVIFRVVVVSKIHSNSIYYTFENFPEHPK
jgi:hypothetical protein